MALIIFESRCFKPTQSGNWHLNKKLPPFGVLVTMAAFIFIFLLCSFSMFLKPVNIKHFTVACYKPTLRATHLVTFLVLFQFQIKSVVCIHTKYSHALQLRTFHFSWNAIWTSSVQPILIAMSDTHLWVHILGVVRILYFCWERVL